MAKKSPRPVGGKIMLKEEKQRRQNG